MAEISTLISELSARLRANGSNISYRPLDVIAATAAFLEDAGVPIDGEAASAAFAVALLGPADARILASNLGIRSDLIPDFVAPPFGYDEYALLQQMREPDVEKAIVGFAAFYVRYLAAAVNGPVSEFQKLHSLFSSLNPSHPKLVGSLATLIEKIKVNPEAASVPTTYVFSISIDLVGSTAAKSAVMRLAKGDPKRIDEFNLRIYAEFFRIENEFYRSATNRHVASSQPIELKKFFVVKGIGDEIWILCKVLQEEVESVGHRLIDAALQVATKAVNFFATEHREEPHFNRMFDPGETEYIRSPVKVYLDLLKHASSIGTSREDFLRREIPALLRDGLAREPNAYEITEANRNLGLSSFEPIGVSTAREHRTDYIGHEIDRFFRGTKMALPGIVTIGETMKQEMGLELVPSGVGRIASVQKANRTPLMAGSPHDQLMSWEPKHTEWKGIGGVYYTFCLFAPRMLKGLYVQMDADRANGFASLRYSDTAKCISRTALDKIVRPIIDAQRRQVR